MRKLIWSKSLESSWQCPRTAPVMGILPRHKAGLTAVAPQAVDKPLLCGVMSALLCLSPGADPAEPLFLVTFLTVSDRRAVFLLPQVPLTGLNQKAPRAWATLFKSLFGPEGGPCWGADVAPNCCCPGSQSCDQNLTGSGHHSQGGLRPCGGWWAWGFLEPAKTFLWWAPSPH